MMLRTEEMSCETNSGMLKTQFRCVVLHVSPLVNHKSYLLCMTDHDQDWDQDVFPLSVGEGNENKICMPAFVRGQGVDKSEWKFRL